MISTSPKVFNAAYRPYLDEQRRTQIFFGGASSGKSRFLAQRCIYDLLKGRNYLIVRNVSNTIRTSTFNEIRKVISAWNLSGSIVFFVIFNLERDIVKSLNRFIAATGCCKNCRIACHLVGRASRPFVCGSTRRRYLWPGRAVQSTRHGINGHAPRYT